MSIAEMVRVLYDVEAERERQIDQWGHQDHTPEKWQGILGEEFGEVCKVVNGLVFGMCDDTPKQLKAHLREELIQVAAVAVAWAEGLSS